MPSVSQDQATAAAMALQCKKGQMPKSQLKGAAKEMCESMTAKELREYASTKRKGKPEQKKTAQKTSKKSPGRPKKKS